VLSRLKQYRELLVIGALLLFPLALFLGSSGKTRKLNPLDRSIIWITSGIQSGITWGIEGFASNWNAYTALRGVRNENEALKNENRELRGKLQQLEEVAAENDRLRRLLSYTQGQPFKPILARVVGVNPDATQLSVKIDRGEAAGVHPWMPVATSEGIVGRILQTTAGYADVLLIADVTSKIGVRVKTSRTRATASGTGRIGPLRLENVARADPLNVGDLIITSGTDRIFPAGLLVGVTSSVEQRGSGMFQVAELKPAVDLTKLEEVLILSPSQAPAKAEIP
jgi:rod shape-determining protein MreC